VRASTCLETQKTVPLSPGEPVPALDLCGAQLMSCCLLWGGGAVQNHELQIWWRMTPIVCLQVNLCILASSLHGLHGLVDASQYNSEDGVAVWTSRSRCVDETIRYDEVEACRASSHAVFSSIFILTAWRKVSAHKAAVCRSQHREAKVRMWITSIIK